MCFLVAGPEKPAQVKGDGELSVVSADYTIRAQWDTAYVVDVTVVVAELVAVVVGVVVAVDVGDVVAEVV